MATKRSDNRGREFYRALGAELKALVGRILANHSTSPVHGKPPSRRDRWRAATSTHGRWQHARDLARNEDRIVAKLERRDAAKARRKVSKVKRAAPVADVVTRAVVLPARQW